MDTRRISVNAFEAQIIYHNSVRVAADLPPFNVEAEVRAAIRAWRNLLDEARARLRARAGRDLADNWFTHQVLCREITPMMEVYWSDLSARSA